MLVARGCLLPLVDAVGTRGLLCPPNLPGELRGQWCDAPSGLKLRGKDIGKPIEKGPKAK